ncbi:MAG: DUF2332 family protein [Pelagimonas sp.]|jgi:hypothetical protein|nr:DUF2332 family protein [Pelagimonas sp.]
MTALTEAFAAQAPHCETLGSPFMARLLRLLAVHWPTETHVDQILSHYQGDIGPLGHSLPLRLCGGLHALALSGLDQGIKSVYPPNSVDDSTLWRAVEHALRGHAPFWSDWLALPPQTNEVRRAAGLISAASVLNTRFDLPLKLSELGASAGLNLMFDRFQMDVAKTRFGPDSGVQLTPDWTGPLPAPTPIQVAERRGVDLNPLDAQDPQAQLRLLAYLWPDQTDRLERTRAAIALNDVTLDQGDAIDWLEQRLSPTPGQLHLIYSTIAWQYFPKSAQARGADLIRNAGANAGPDTPLAWLQMEADGQTPGAALSLQLWTGAQSEGHAIALGRIDFHGRWVDWQGPTDLSNLP